MDKYPPRESGPSGEDPKTPTKEPTAGMSTTVFIKTERAQSDDTGEFWFEVDSNPETVSRRNPTGETISDSVVFEEAGRTFQAYRPSTYFLPNDGMEQDRLDMFHEVWLQLLDRQLGLAPVKSPLNVLDIATGTGIWAFQFADDHPDSRVIGTDLSMIQPSAVRMLPNCTFVREDSEEHWIFDHKFDYIHMRAVCSCFNDPLTVIQHSFDNLNAGGWVEIQDVCMELHGVDKTIEDTELQRFCRLGRQGFQLLGRDVVDRVFRYKKWLIDAGFVDVIEKRLPVPVNPWPRDARLKNLGRYNHAQLYEGMKSGAVKTLPAAGLSPQLAEELLNRALKDLSNTSIHGYLPFYVVYGRKPYTDEAGSNSGHGTTPSVS